MEIISCATPSWFSTTEILLQIIFVLVTIFISYYSHKVYKIIRQRSSLLYSLGFLSVSIAYLIQAVLNFFLLKGVSTSDIVSFTIQESAKSGFQLSIGATIFHVIFMILGLSLLAFVTFKERGVKMFLLPITLSFVGLVFSASLSLTFYGIASIFLLFIAAQYYQRHAKQGKLDSMFTFLGFGMLFLGTIQIALAQSANMLYVSGHFITLIGYVLLLINLLRVVKK